MEFEEFVLAASTADLKEEPGAREHADAIEFRLDLASAPFEQLAAYDGELPILATNRVTREGGQALAKPERLDELVRVLDHPAVEAVDVELDAIRAGDGMRVVEQAHEHEVSVVASTHDFETTPARNELRSVLSEACEYGEVGKLAVTAHSPEDVLDVLAVTREATVRGEIVATMAMGEVGRHSRVVAPLYGSRLGFAPVAAEAATAPGQYDLETFRQLLEQLRADGSDD